MKVELGIPSAPTRPTSQRSISPDVSFSMAGHYFNTTLEDDALDALCDSWTLPLSVIYQVTRRCNFDCTFCSEIDQIKDPSLKEIELVKERLAGVPRIFISGGEPLIRRDIVDVVDTFAEDHIVSIPTNATRGHHLAKKLAGKVSFMNVGLEGPRNATNRVRGDYDQIMRGMFAFREAGLGISLSSVVLRTLLPDLPYLIQIADVFDAGKVKLIHPIRKGNGATLPDDEFLTLEESAQMFDELAKLRAENGWTPSLRMTTWTRETEGYSILIYPDSTVWAWPVFGGVAEMGTQGGSEDKTLYLGNLYEEPMTEIWRRYPYKRNHLRKYLGKSISVSYNEAGDVIDARRKQSAVGR